MVKNLARFTTEDITSSNVSEPAPSYDMMFRVMGSEVSGAFVYSMAKTEDVCAYLAEQINEKDRALSDLVSVVHWQHSLLDYNSHYNAYLLEQIDEDEFGKVAEQFAYEPQHVNPSLIAPAIERIYRLTGVAYTPSEIAGLFKCDQEDALTALSLIASTLSTFKAMLPVDE